MAPTSLASWRRARTSLSIVLVGLFAGLLTISNIGVTADYVNAENCSAIVNNTECCSTSDCEWILCHGKAASCENKPASLQPNCSNECLGSSTAIPETTTHNTNSTTSHTVETTITHTTATTPTEPTTHSTASTQTSTGPTEHTTTVAATTRSETTGTSQAVTTHSGTTGATIPPTTVKPPSCGGFDGASFVGGIVLGLGLMGIAFLIYKFYMSRHRGAAPYQQF